MSYLRNYSTRQTPQSQPIPGSNQQQNNAGGYTFALDDWGRLQRFLVLGTEGGTYYVGEQELTKRNAEASLRCIEADGKRVVDLVVEISEAGRAAKNDPALFVLAMASAHGDDETRKYALDALPRVARIGTHLFHFLAYVQNFRGWGRGLRNAVGTWYNEKNVDTLAYQLVKYQQRDGWSHRDALRLAHPVPSTQAHGDLYAWAVGKPISKSGHPLVLAFLAAQTASETELIKLIADYGLTREMIPTEHLNRAPVWEALLDKMPLEATIRNLGNMGKVGLLIPGHWPIINTVVDRLTDQAYLQKSRIHPLKVLAALNTYAKGSGFRGSGRWEAIPQVTDALNEAFYLSFGNVTPTGKTHLLSLDVSGSMGMGTVSGVGGITPRVGSAAMAMLRARVERQYIVMGFTGGFVPLNISPNQRLDDIVNTISRLPFDATDCAQPMLYALQRNLHVDVFEVYTDNETWAGRIHPIQALTEYRQQINPNAKLVVVGMVANKFSIADPNDAGSLDVVGFDTATPQAISEFVAM